jgi:uncharacterized protein (DUF305 family)
MSRISRQCDLRAHTFALSLNWMKFYVVLALVLFVTTSCTQRPTHTDVVIEGNTMTHSVANGRNVQSSPGAATAPFELQFIDTMIELDLTAIDAEQLVATRAQHLDLKQLAGSMIAGQQEEIASLKQLRSSWFGDMSQAVNFDLSGAAEGVKMIDLVKLDLLKENAFDREFLTEMVPLDEGSITLAKDLTGKEVHPELKQLAENIIRDRQAKIEQMKEWQNDWSKP